MKLQTTILNSMNVKGIPKIEHLSHQFKFCTVGSPRNYEVPLSREFGWFEAKCIGIGLENLLMNSKAILPSSRSSYPWPPLMQASPLPMGKSKRPCIRTSPGNWTSLQHLPRRHRYHQYQAERHGGNTSVHVRPQPLVTPPPVPLLSLSLLRLRAPPSSRSGTLEECKGVYWEEAVVVDTGGRRDFTSNSQSVARRERTDLHSTRPLHGRSGKRRSGYFWFWAFFQRECELETRKGGSILSSTDHSTQHGYVKSRSCTPEPFFFWLCRIVLITRICVISPGETFSFIFDH